MNKPTPIRSGHKGVARRQVLELDIVHLPHVHEPRKEHNGQGRPVILDKHPRRMLEQRALAQFTADICDREYQERDNYRQVKRLAIPERLEDLDPLLQVNKRHVEPKDVTWEPRHVSQPVTRVRDGQDPVKDK